MLLGLEINYKKRKRRNIYTVHETAIVGKGVLISSAADPS